MDLAAAHASTLEGLSWKWLGRTHSQTGPEPASSPPLAQEGAPPPLEGQAPGSHAVAQAPGSHAAVPAPGSHAVAQALLNHKEHADWAPGVDKHHPKSVLAPQDVEVSLDGPPAAAQQLPADLQQTALQQGRRASWWRWMRGGGREQAAGLGSGRGGRGSSGSSDVPLMSSSISDADGRMTSGDGWAVSSRAGAELPPPPPPALAAAADADAFKRKPSMGGRSQRSFKGSHAGSVKVGTLPAVHAAVHGGLVRAC